LAKLRCGDRELPLTFTNETLAHLQAAVHRRFRMAGGFFLTGTRSDDEGNEVTTSYWLHPSVPLSFEYDVRGDDGERVPPVELDFNQVDAILDAMARPVGVHDGSDVWLSFREKL
jgi:hypothetical protein